MAKLSDSRVVNALRPDPKGRDITVFDDRITGLGVRLKRSGKKSWVLKYRTKHGEQRRYTIGDAGKHGVSPSDARDAADELKVRIRKGEDPAADRRAARKAQTVAELCDQYLESREAMIDAGDFKASTLAMDRSRIKRHVKPLIGKKHVVSLTVHDIEKFIRDVRVGKSAPAKRPASDGEPKRRRGGLTAGGPGAAARTYSMLRTILQRAVRDKIISANPARQIEKGVKPKDTAKRLPYDAKAVAALGKALRTAEAERENQSGLRAIRFLLLTGCRRMEVLTLTWVEVDRAKRCLRLKDTKTGAQVRPIGSAALALLASFEPKDAKQNDYVFPGEGEAGHFVGLPKVWHRVAKRAGIEGVSVHGLRHWFASAAAEMNFSELTIAGLLGHHVKGVTARYATAPDSSLLAAADAVSLALSAALGDREDAKVVQLAAYG